MNFIKFDFEVGATYKCFLEPQKYEFILIALFESIYSWDFSILIICILIYTTIKMQYISKTILKVY